MNVETQVLWGLGVFASLLFLIMLRKVLVKAVKLLLRTAAGAGALGVQLGVNLCNALVLGVLGAPGFGLLLMLNWLVRSG